MSSKPKSSDYQPSEAEKINAAVAKADKDYFDQRYSQLLREMRDIAERLFDEAGPGLLIGSPTCTLFSAWQ